WRASRAGVRRFTLGSPPPLHVQTVDLRQELRAGRNTFLSTPLRQALASALAAGEQAVLFLNRRGAARMLLCRRCGVTLQCRRCITALAITPPMACCVATVATPANHAPTSAPAAGHRPWRSWAPACNAWRRRCR